MGETTNLMQIDTQKFLDLTLYLNLVWTSPLQIILAMYFLWDILGPSSLAGNAVNSEIEARLLFNFWTFGIVLYLSICQFLFNKNPNFHEFFSFLFETEFYSKKSSIPEFTVYVFFIFHCA